MCVGVPAVAWGGGGVGVCVCEQDGRGPGESGGPGRPGTHTQASPLPPSNYVWQRYLHRVKENSGMVKLPLPVLKSNGTYRMAEEPSRV